ncbi:Bacterial regulatory protein, gntR family [Planctomycetes bacterium Pan216]|uniref:Bacterial regulatory protein, gntR family n=1 Tax=Kolteria novifilia TaxID=2527975 RepID=A0A518B0E5_9BACT|nr:Bacterial regulatory protein, gntR family [Planctomycetes bacterium Pan216]
MTESGIAAPSAKQLAGRVLRDMRERGVLPGDRYLTAREVGELLGVSAMTANRAMQVLARQGILTRERRAGTFVGDRFEADESPGLACLHLLIPRRSLRSCQQFLGPMILGLSREWPEAAIQYTLLPADHQVEFVKRLFESPALPKPSGAVLFVSSPELQRYASESHLPIVVSGSLHPDVENLCWVDRDQRKMGRLLADEIVTQGHQRVAVLMRDLWGSGDNLFLDGVQSSLSDAGLPIDALTVRSVAHEESLLAPTIQSLLKVRRPPTALLCRPVFAADVASRVARDLKLRVPRDLEIFAADYYASDGVAPLYPCTTPLVGYEQQGAIIGRMLHDLSRGEYPDPNHMVIDVALLPLAAGRGRKKG